MLGVKNNRTVKAVGVNLLTSNQATGTDTLGTTAGFTGFRGTETISSDATTYFQGAKSLKVITPGSQAYEGMTVVSTVVDVSNTYTTSIYLKGTEGVPLQVLLAEYTAADVSVGSTLVPVVLTGGWDCVTVGRIFGATGAKARIWVRTTATPLVTTFYADKIGLYKIL